MEWKKRTTISQTELTNDRELDKVPGTSGRPQKKSCRIRFSLARKGTRLPQANMTR
jgi:hypothetical protein